MEDVAGLIKVSSRDQNDKIVNENVGYIMSDVTSAPTLVAAVKSYGQAIVSLTDNIYRSTNVTYDINLDNLDEG